MKNVLSAIVLVAIFYTTVVIPTAAAAPHRDVKLLATEKVTGSEAIWADPGFADRSQANPRANGGVDRAVVWFDQQFLGDGQSYLKRSKEFAGWKRHELRAAVVKTLKALSDTSFAKAKTALAKLEKEGKIAGIRRHWIVNGFTCDLKDGGLDGLKTVPGVRKIFQPYPNPALRPAAPNAKEYGGRTVPKVPAADPFDPDRYEHTWNLEKIGAVRTWKELKITGKGTLNVIHDFGFQLEAPNLVQNIYRNPREIPDNNIDDDKNGYVDDYHGFDFDKGNNALNIATAPRPGMIHGNACAALVAGTGTKDVPVELGVAPESRWLPLIGTANFEEALEWAIEHDVDTFSMSYTLFSLGEYRSHWRKAMEQAALCGLFLAGGAGNFANDKNPNYLPIPIQMGTPKDVPEAVFVAAGVNKNMERPIFSSQGPVEWSTDHYKDGSVPKPDIDAFNFDIPFLNVETRKMSETPIQGNSFAGPHIAGVLALMISADPELTPWTARQILASTATDLFTPGFDMQSGYGLANAYEAVKEVIRRRNENAKTKA